MKPRNLFLRIRSILFVRFYSWTLWCTIEIHKRSKLFCFLRKLQRKKVYKVSPMAWILCFRRRKNLVSSETLWRPVRAKTRANFSEFRVLPQPSKVVYKCFIWTGRSACNVPVTIVTRYHNFSFWSKIAHLKQVRGLEICVPLPARSLFFYMA
jgi:hypothetical protein